MFAMNLILFIFHFSLFSLVIGKNNDEEDLCPYQPQDVDLDANPLVNLGNSLKHRLSSMSCPHGILLYKDLQRYYNKLSDIYRLLKRRDAVDIVKGFKVYTELENRGGPPHLNVTMDYYELKNKYKWTDSGEVKDVKEVMMLTKELWEDMEDRAAHLRSGKPEATPVEQSTIDWTPFLREVSSGSDDEGTTSFPREDSSGSVDDRSR